MPQEVNDLILLSLYPVNGQGCFRFPMLKKEKSANDLVRETIAALVDDTVLTCQIEGGQTLQVPHAQLKNMIVIVKAEFSQEMWEKYVAWKEEDAAKEELGDLLATLFRGRKL